jgi:hypothetical protein
MIQNTPVKNTLFTVTFPSGHKATAVCVAPNADPTWITNQFGFLQPQPAIFISGGASYMTPEDQKITESMMENVAQFAHERKAIIITGGTEAGVMKTIGDTRRKYGYQFPLVGVAPLGKVDYPGYSNPNKEATLEDDHTHFVLVDAPEWGDESELIVRLTHTVARQVMPEVGILVNGGKIAANEVYLATTKDLKLPMIVLEGSGRFADELATAVRTGKTNQRILQAILAGGDIKLVATVEGPNKLREKLVERFDRK